MGIFATPPKTTKGSFRRGDTHQGVGAIQLAMNALGNALTVDGNFGAQTEEVVEAFQSHRGLSADGVVGPATQARIAVGFEEDAEREKNLPDGLMRGVLQGESGLAIAAVNWSVAGGVDCGYTQRRVTGPPWYEPTVRRAFDPKVQIALAAEEFASRYKAYRAKGIPSERAWRIAVLAHNWPVGAGVLARGDQLSSTRLATWAPTGTKFADGAPVRTFRDWSEFYSMGSRAHNHAGIMVRFAFGVP